jgi:hypothetical protein
MLSNSSSSNCLFNKPTWHHARPGFIEEAMNRCRFIQKKGSFSQRIGKVSAKQLDALKSFSQALLHYTDLATLQYGVWNKDRREFVDFDLKILRSVTGLSSYYFNKCIVLLKKAGFMTVHKMFKEKPPRHVHRGSEEYNKSFKSAPSVRRLTLDFFIALGFNKERLERNKLSAYNKQEDKIREEKHRYAEINKPSPHKWFVPEPVKKDPNGASQMSKIKDLIKNMRFGKRSPDPDP